MKIPKGIRKRGDKFFVDVTVQGRRRTGTADTLAEAKDMRVTLRAALIAGEGRDVGAKTGPGWTLGEAFDRTLTLVWEGSRSETTAKLNAQAAIDHFGRTMPLSEIDTNALDGYVMRLMDKGNSNATVNRKLAALSKMMSVAVDRGGLERKPKVPKRKEPVGRTRYLTPEEEAKVLAQVTAWGQPMFHDALVILLDTGLRLGELLRLDRQAIEGNNITVWVTKADLPRTIPMTKRAKVAIDWRIAAMTNTEAWKDPKAPLFPVSPRWMQVQWDRVRHHLGLDDVTLHIMRHTCASRLVQRGVGLPVVQQWMGHKTIQVTLRYAHLSPTNFAQAAAALEQYCIDDAAAARATWDTLV